MEAAQSADKTTKGKTFSSQLARLKEIVAQLEKEDLELEKGVRLYREACVCVRFCRQKLSDARNVLESEEGGLRDAEEFLKDGKGGSGESGSDADDGVSAPGVTDGGYQSGNF